MARKADPTIRGRLLSAARAEFSASGLDGAKVSEITRRAGISKGAFYLHFDTKDRAFEEVAQDFFDILHAMMLELDPILESDRDLETVASEVLAHDIRIMEFLWSERQFARILFEGAHSSKHIPLIEAFARRVQTHIEKQLSIDLRRGRLPEGTNVELFAAFLAGGWDRYARCILSSDEKPNLEADVSALHQFTLKGLFVPNPPATEASTPNEPSMEAAQ